MDRPPVALVVALASEYRALRLPLDSPRRWMRCEFPIVAGRLEGQAVVLVQAGIGRDRARHAVLTISRRVPLRAAWSLGFAGGLTATLGPGDLVCPHIVLQEAGGSGRPMAAGAAHGAVCAALAAAGHPVQAGPLLTVDAPLRTPQLKRNAHARTGAIAVDMEAAGVAEAAQHLGIPWLALKAVVDGVEDALPGFLAKCTTAGGAIRWQGLVWALFAAGEHRRTLRRLGQASREAVLSLRGGLDVALAAQLP